VDVEVVDFDVAHQGSAVAVCLGDDARELDAPHLETIELKVARLAPDGEAAQALFAESIVDDDAVSILAMSVAALDVTSKARVAGLTHRIVAPREDPVFSPAHRHHIVRRLTSDFDLAALVRDDQRSLRGALWERTEHDGPILAGGNIETIEGLEVDLREGSDKIRVIDGLSSGQREDVLGFAEASVVRLALLAAAAVLA